MQNPLMFSNNDALYKNEKRQFFFASFACSAYEKVCAKLGSTSVSELSPLMKGKWYRFYM